MKTKEPDDQRAAGPTQPVVRPLSDDQKKALAGHKMQMQMAIDGEDKGIISYRCESLGLSKSIVTPREKGAWGKQEVTYFIDEDDREFLCLADAVDALVAKGKLSV